MPFYVRGPGISPGTTVSGGAFVSIDILPTFLQLGGVPLADIDTFGFDGEPQAAYLISGIAPGIGDDGDDDASGVRAPPRDFLIEYFGEQYDGCAPYLENDFPGRGWAKLDDGVNCGVRGPQSYATPPFWQGDETWSSIQDTSNNTYSCVRRVVPGAASVGRANSEDTQFCSWATGEAELFDLVADPWQLTNLAPGLSAEALGDWLARLARLRACKGRSATA